MTHYDFDKLGDLEPKEFAAMVKNTPDAELAAALHSDNRGKILDAIFAKMPSFFRADRAGSTSAVIHWNIADRADGGVDTYEFVIADGACTLSPAPAHDPKLAITVNPVDFVKVVSGNGNPVMMFMTGKLKAKGDLGLAANIQNLFDIPKA
jgi:putative sterol carrier protein